MALLEVEMKSFDKIMAVVHHMYHTAQFDSMSLGTLHAVNYAVGVRHMFAAQLSLVISLID